MYCLRIFLKLWKTNNFVKFGKLGRSVGQGCRTGLGTGFSGYQRRSARFFVKRFNIDSNKIAALATFGLYRARPPLSLPYPRCAAARSRACPRVACL